MIGETFSHFRITEAIGKGAGGEVYRAIDVQLDRPVAIKFLAQDQGGSAESRERFLHEARVASSLDHPHVGTIFEAGETPDGRLYLVMGYYGGGSLRDRLEVTGKLPVDEAADLLEQVASALARAHEAGIVHGDVKPENILFAEDGAAKLIDFGIARLAEQETSIGLTTGTLSYMAPEQAAGEAYGPSADVFALGALFYELLSGQRAFAGEYEAAVLYSLAHEEPPPLIVSGVEIPESWQEVLDRALAKTTQNRFADASGILEALRAARAPEPAAPPTDTPSAPPGRRRLAAIVGVGTVVVAVALFFGYRWFDGPESSRERALAVCEFQNLTGQDDPTLVQALGGLVHVGLVESSPIRIVSPDFLQDLRRRRFGDDPKASGGSEALEIARDAGASLLLIGQLTEVSGRRLVTWRLVETDDGGSVAASRAEGDDLAALADNIIAGVLDRMPGTSGTLNGAPESVTRLTTENSQAYRYYTAAQLAQDGRQFSEAVRHLEAAVHLDSTFAMALLDLSEIYYTGTEIGVDYGKARDLADRAWRQRDRLGVKDRLRLEAWLARLDYRIDHARDVLRELHDRWPDDRSGLADLHNLLFYFWYSNEALEVAEQGLELYPDDEMHFGLYYQIGLDQVGRHEEALAATRRYLTRHPNEPNAWDEMGWRFLAQGESDSAEVAFGEALALDPDFFPGHWGMAWAAWSRGDLEEAVTRGEALIARPGLADGQKVAVMTANAFWPGISLFQAEAGRFREALAQFDRAEPLVGDEISSLRVRSNWARTMLRFGRPDAVLAWADSLRSARPSLDEETLGRLATSYGAQFRALALAARGDLDAAEEMVAELESLESSFGGQTLYLARKTAAEIALARGDGQRALELLARNARQVLPHGGLFAIEHLEALARAHLLLGDTAAAHRVLDSLMRVYGGDLRALVLRGDVLAAEGKTTKAAAAYRTFLEAWVEADPGLALVADVREKLESLAGS